MDLQKVALRKVVRNKELVDIIVEVVPFDRYSEAHTDFAFQYMDMLGHAPSPFKDIKEASKAYVKLFMKHTAEDEKDPNSDFSTVYADTRACRLLLHQPDIQQALADFFGNA